MNKDSIATKVQEFFSTYPLRQDSKGQILVHAGDNPPGIFYLITGQVQQYDISDKGEPVVVNVFKPGAFFPMSWAINKTPNQYFFETATDVEYILAPAKEVVQYLQTNPEVTFDLLARVYSGTDGLLRRMAHIMGGSARTRILFELLVQTSRFGRPEDGKSYLVKLSEQELANRAGLSRETVSRGLGGLKDLVTVTREGMLIHDPLLLEEELGTHL